MAKDQAVSTGRVQVEKCQKRVRALLGGQVVFDTIDALLVWELPYYPAYYVPTKDVYATLTASEKTEHSPSRGEAQYFDVQLGDQLAKDGAFSYPKPRLLELADHTRFVFEAMQEWLEEDEPIYVHPRSPYTRVDILASSRQIKVVLDGVEVADSDQPQILFETGLPPRYYLPLSHIRTELLRPSASQSHCPYKGTAEYFSLQINDKLYTDYVWIYRSPLPESAKIAGRGCFYNEKLDIYLDGVLQQRPRTHFS